MIGVDVVDVQVGCFQQGNARCRQDMERHPGAPSQRLDGGTAVTAQFRRLSDDRTQDRCDAGGVETRQHGINSRTGAITRHDERDLLCRQAALAGFAAALARRSRQATAFAPRGLPLNDSRMNVSSASTVPHRLSGLSRVRAFRNRCRQRNAGVWSTPQRCTLRRLLPHAHARQRAGCGALYQPPLTPTLGRPTGSCFINGIPAQRRVDVSGGWYYLSGLAQAEDCTFASMAAVVDGGCAQQFQHFISNSPWDHAPVLAQIGRDADRLLGGKPANCLVIDESSFAKQGGRSVGVARQWSGRLGKVDNCQVAVFGVLTDGQRHVPVDTRLYLPKVWIENPARCDEAGVPATARKLTAKSEHALDIVRQARARRMRFNWVGVDAGYGKEPAFLRVLDDIDEVFVAGHPPHATGLDRRARTPRSAAKTRPRARGHAAAGFGGGDHRGSAGQDL